MTEHPGEHRPLRCPDCGATSEDTEFILITPYKASGSHIILGLDSGGVLRVRVLDGGQPEEFFTPRIGCRMCGHEWATKRDWQTDHG